MGFGAFTQYIDIPQVVLYLFWIFFAGLLWYLRREDKREGYPLESDRSRSIRIEGFPRMPSPKIFRLHGGATYTAPPGNPETREIRAASVQPWNGSPQQPMGNPMTDAVGPASYSQRENRPDLTVNGEPMIVPMRVAMGYTVAAEDPDPRGMVVMAADNLPAGKVTDIWVDRAEPQIRYLEVQLDPAIGTRSVLLPIGYLKFNKSRRIVQVSSILAGQFAGVPVTAQPDVVTLLEEDRITGYYAGGHLYAEPSRFGPII
jgi:photosynthetic reaction center H subunit